MNSDFEDDDLDEEISEPCAEGSGVTIEDFVAYMPAHSYFFTPCRDAWSERSVNARLPRQKALGKNGKPKRIKGEPVYISASRWLDQNRPVEQMTWCPGLPMLIPDQLVVDGGWIERKGVTCFNLYRPPRIKPGDASKAGPWLDHVRKIYPDDTDHIINYLAQRVQRPQEKINHALVLGGAQGIGKDTIIEPAKHAVGPWNFHEVSPQQMLGRFNGFIKSVILRVSEARDLGEVNRFSFYEHMKAYTAAPPDVLRVDEKKPARAQRPQRVRYRPHDKPQHRWHLSARRRSPALRGLVDLEERTILEGVLAGAVGLVLRRWRHRARRGLPHGARHLWLRPEGAAAQDAGVLEHRQRQPSARGR
jgi:hypothetical protein